MCLILIGWRVNADYPLVLAANRDEFYSRSSAAAHWWPDQPGLLEPGVYGLSNHLLDTPWPKVRQSKSRLTAALDNALDNAALLHLLRDEQTAAEHELPRTGVSREWERLLSSAFIRGADYGTRCSTVIRSNAQHHMHFHEWTWDAGGSLVDEVATDFAVETGAAST